MTTMSFSVTGQHVVVVGAARSGIAAADLLLRRGARVTLTDVKPAIEGAAEVVGRGARLELGGHIHETFLRADLVVVSPGVKLDQPALVSAREAGIPVIGELELASRWLRGRVIAVTGTKGKSTTTTLAGLMLEKAGFRVRVGGNIGVPLSAQVDDSTAETLHVVEASSFQLQSIDTFHPWIAALLNFSPDHLDQHASIEEYAAAKAAIFRNQTADDWAVVNAEDRPAEQLAATSRARRVRYGLALSDEGFTVTNGAIVERRAGVDTSLVPVGVVRVPGRHILSDVVAAAAISRTAGADPDAMRAAVSGFAGLEHAMEVANTIDGVQFVNDSKATNIDAARRSIESVPSNLVVVMGGRYKGGDFSSLAEPLSGRAVAVVAIGEAAPLIETALSGVVRVVRAETMGDAVRMAFGLAPAAGTVVLAPGCSSFDMFRDYAERGRAFKEEVRRLAVERRATREQ
jgi:UDP-N-acetylmuramoylalanine--D-glutamate ligase